MTEERKYAILFAATLLAARKLFDLDPNKPTMARQFFVDKAIDDAAYMAEDTQTGGLLRYVNDVDLFDVSVVTYAAYQDTEVNARSLWPEGKPEYLTAAGLERRSKKLGLRVLTTEQREAEQNLNEALNLRLLIGKMR